MRLAVDGWRLHGPLTGIGRYASNVLRNWTEDAVGGRFDRITLYTPAPVDRSVYALPTTIEERVVGPHWPQLPWQNLRLARAARDDDVLFCPAYARPVVSRPTSVVTIFEATQKLFPEHYPWRVRLVNSPLYEHGAKRSALVITATETARHDIAKSYGVCEEKIRVVPLAPADVFRREVPDATAVQIATRFLASDRPYVLFLGKLTARRNAPLLVEAFAELKRRRDLPEALLVVGLNTTGVDLPALAGQHGIADSFRYVEHVADDELGPLVARATAFVMPYSYEALSLTALEAQASGTAVVTVDTPGLREQTGGHALFIERPELGQLVDAMERILGDDNLRRRLEEEGREHAAQFTWERCSRETLDVLAEAASV